MEDYKEKYENALAKIKQIFDKGSKFVIRREVFESIFPELKESEDEKVRKEIINYFECQSRDEPERKGIHNRWIDWIEKQGEKKPLYIRFGDVPSNETSKIYRGEEEVGNENGVSVYPAFEVNENIVLGLTLPITKTTLYTQQHLLEYDNRPCYLVSGDYVGKGTDGEPLIRNISIIKRLDNYRIKEFEKQGEQEEPQVYKTEDGEIITHSESEGYKVIEPKFKVGDWITDGEAVFHITSYDIDYGYQLETQKGTSFHFSDEKVESKYHLWTIQDAKDGDVLAEDTCIFIIQKLGDNSTSAKTYCTLYNDGDFDDGSILYFDIDSTKPATKEQCDLLFQKMKEVGYEWDAEKKELKKIEKKPAWSEEDDYNLQCMIAKVTSDIQKGNVGRNNELIDWLKSLKERVQPQPKQEWSDEDEFRLNRTVENIELLNDANGNILFKDIECLKSLKNRLSKVKNC